MGAKPGFELEENFCKWLKSCQEKMTHNITAWYWISYFSKEAPMDFLACTYTEPDTMFYLDTVSWRPEGKSVRLSTAHKDWNNILKWCKEDFPTWEYHKYCGKKQFKAYLVYSCSGGRLADWQFIRITKDLPAHQDLFISKSRIKGVRTADSVFGRTLTREEKDKHDLDHKVVRIYVGMSPDDNYPYKVVIPESDIMTLEQMLGKPR